MSEYQQNSDGINSLAGFAYQIKVFILHMLLMEENMQIEFETADDVAMRRIDNNIENNIDENEDFFRTKLISENDLIVYQVKKTTISNSVAENVFLNWILLEESNQKIKKYFLVTDSAYNNKDKILDLSVDKLFSKILSNTQKKSTIAKVRDIFKNDNEKFKTTFNAIMEKHRFLTISNIDQEIYEKCRILFKKSGVTDIIYLNRIKTLLSIVTSKILDSISDKRPYCITFKEFMTCAEKICNDITDQEQITVYSDFKKNSKINLRDLKVVNSREYKQLKACNLTQNLIEQHLIYKSYYEDYRYRSLELNKTDILNDIEVTTFENFEFVKYDLVLQNRDSPYNRLAETKNKSNKYARNNQIKYGSGIYLTRAEEIENQISWEDENEE